ncbi:ABC transporter substrate-binding protein [Anaerococcus sp. ENR0831]|uniref:ABC transporter substrate-binding protein n=1 Tax=Anaerococcus martiniensis TaxID=3115615 RepID=A0ABW9M7K0_9FIRM
MERISKKLFMNLALILALSLPLVGCNADENTDAQTPTTAEEQADEAVEKVEEKKTEENKDSSQEEDDKEAKEEKESDGEAVKGGSYVVAMTAEPTSYNPDALDSSGNYRVSQNIFNRLVKINGNDEVVPDIAESWEFSEDGTVLTFKLHEAKWHDGTDFTAEDVKWTFDNIKEQEGFAANSLKSIKEINVVDDRTVDFVLDGPNAGILGAIAWQGTFIMPKHIYEGSDWLENEANQNPVGTGPFKFVEQVEGDRVVIERNDDYFGNVPYLDEVVFKVMPDGASAYQAWLAGEIDDGPSVPQEEKDEFENNPKYNKVLLDWPNKSYFCFNMKDGIFKDPLLRQAVLYGIDLDDIFERGYKSVGEQQKYFIPWQYDWAINEDVTSPERDVEKARELIEEAGYQADEDGIYFDVTIDTFPGWDEIMPIFQKQFEEFGIKLNHNSLDDPSYDKKVLEDQDFDLTVLGGYIGPDISALSTRLGTDGFMNYGLYSSEEMDALLKEGEETVDHDERAEVYKKVQELQEKDLPLVYFRDMFAEEYVKSYIHNHPSYEDMRETCSEHEYTNIWLED